MHVFILPPSSCVLLFSLLFCGCETQLPANTAAAVSEANDYADVVSKIGGRLEMRLDFSNSDITDKDLETLPLPEGVRSIDLSNTNITDAGIAHLRRAAKVEQLNLMSTKITDASLDHFRAMESLWSVSIENTQVSRAGHLDLLRFLAPRVHAHNTRVKP